MRLKATEISRKIFGAAHLGERFGAANGVNDVVAVGSENGVDHVIGKAANITHVECKSLAHESSDGQRLGIDSSSNERARAAGIPACKVGPCHR